MKLKKKENQDAIGIFHSDHYAQMIHISLLLALHTYCTYMYTHAYIYNGNELSLHDNKIIISVSFFIKYYIISASKRAVDRSRCCTVDLAVRGDFCTHTATANRPSSICPWAVLWHQRAERKKNDFRFTWCFCCFCGVFFFFSFIRVADFVIQKCLNSIMFNVHLNRYRT